MNRRCFFRQNAALVSLGPDYMTQPTSFEDQALRGLKLPPHSIEAEQSVLGGLLLDNTAWDKIADVVRESDFYRDDHRRLVSAVA